MQTYICRHQNRVLLNKYSCIVTDRAKLYKVQNMFTNQFFRGFLITLFSITVLFSNAQLGNDLTNIKASQISDAQILNFLQKASESGMTELQIEQEFQKRGLPSSEMDILRTRIKSLQNGANTSSPADLNKPRTIADNSVRVLPKGASGVSGSIFGSELFSGASTTFEPNLRMPTPRNYVLGPDDELALDISGVNISQQTLKVSAEGAINIKYAGPMYVSGLTIEEATRRITSKLKQYYPSISSGQTKVQVTLGTIRSNRIIIIGAVSKPGTYTLSSLATLFNALYISGGPAENGSFRNIEVIRNDKKVVTADLYNFLLTGGQIGNIRLEDNDLIRIPFAERKISLGGEVNRSGIFELKDKETLADAINFAGGYTVNAYKARITGTRITDFDKRIIDITKESIETYIPQNGDQFSVGSIMDKYQNRITIEGAVFKPGIFSFEPGMTLKQLINKAAGLKEDAYTKRIIITRTREDLTREFISVEYKTVLGIDSSLELMKDDRVQVSSIFDVRDQFSVTINGAVRKPGSYNFEDSLSLKSLILQAGGFAENATGTGIEISRRKRDVNPKDPGSAIVEIIKIDDTKELSQKSADLQLKPFDIINIKADPFYKNQISVSIVGEVLIPGTYTLQSRQERISSLVRRAGGTLYTGNIEGARLRRKNNFYDVDLNVVQKIAASSAKDSSGVVIDAERKPFNEIAINLPEILTNPGNKDDILLQEGDMVFIPLIDNMITISGEVFKPLQISYDSDKTLKDYLYDAGGVTNSANKKRTFVIYPNGKAGKITHSYIFFKKYPIITAGTKIFVPKEPEKKGLDYGKAGIIISAVSAFITAIALAYQISK